MITFGSLPEAFSVCSRYGQLRERDLLLVVEDVALLGHGQGDGLVHLVVVA
jgi:hypothetical protein